MRAKLLEWYSYNGRDLPWRETSDPYSILVSEVMLQQKPVLAGGVSEVHGEPCFSLDQKGSLTPTFATRGHASVRTVFERLDEAQLEFVQEMVPVAGGGGVLDFLVVYGSTARGEANEDSDVDVYFEAGDLPEPFNREDPRRALSCVWGSASEPSQCGTSGG